MKPTTTATTKQPGRGADPDGEPGIASSWLITVGHFAKPNKRARAVLSRNKNCASG